MSELTGQEAPAVASETPNPEVVQDKTATTTQNEDTQASGEDSNAAEAKTFTQEELNDIVKKEKARAEAKAERRVLKALERIAPQQAPAQNSIQEQTNAKPTRFDGEGDDAYIERLTDWKLDQRERASNQQRANEKTQTLASKTEKMYAEASKVPGFDREDFDSLPLTPILAEALIDSEQAPQLMAYMAAHPDEVARIAALSPARQAAEIGKLEVKAATAPKTSKAPAPITPIGSRGSGQTGDYASMTVEQMEADMRKRGSKWIRS